jgi:hypothetical protein
MKPSQFGRAALSCVAAALLAGCGGSQTPVGAPRAQEAFGKGAFQAASDKDYLYISDDLSVSGSQGTVVGVTRLGSPHPFRFEKYTWIDKNTVLGSWGGTPKRYALGYWYYPKGGGPPFRLLDKLHPDFIATGITSGE